MKYRSSWISVVGSHGSSWSSLVGSVVVGSPVVVVVVVVVGSPVVVVVGSLR